MNDFSIEPDHWNKLIYSLEHPHLLQTYQWGTHKSRFGWHPIHKIWKKGGEVIAAALILEREASIRGFSPHFRIMYIPKGPLIQNWTDRKLRLFILNEIKNLAIEREAIFIKIDPNIKLATSTDSDFRKINFDHLGVDITTDLKSLGWRYSQEQIQFRNTHILDLNKGEDELLLNMKQKTRYNVRLARRKGVTVRVGKKADLDLLYQFYVETALRDEFTIRDRDYYISLWDSFAPSKDIVINHHDNNYLEETINNSHNDPTKTVQDLLIAEFKDEPIAAVIYYRFARSAWFLYGMSRSKYREMMPNYLLQWEAIRRARKAGCLSLDFWGAPEDLNEKDPMFGVHRFKAGFGGQYIRFVGAWDLPIRSIQYRFYSHFLPIFLNIMRSRSKEKIKKNLIAE